MAENTQEIVEQFFAALEAMDIEAFLVLWAEDGRQEMPFAPEGFPTVLKDREAVRKQYSGLPESYVSMRFKDRVYYPMQDASWIFAEYQGQIELKSGGTYNNRYCGLWHIVDDKIQLYREYFNPIVLQESFGDSVGKTFSTGQN
jgi:ketosteroid isomerase-like protein